MFLNYYRCDRCRHEWTDAWSAQCDDDCPECGFRHMTPYKSEDLVPPESLARIRRLNDALRKTFSGGTVALSRGVADLPDMVKAAAMVRVREFQDFDEDNDPHQEHDFGSFELCQRTFIFKIDCFDPSKQFASDDPADPAKTARVLTIMLADEW